MWLNQRYEEVEPPQTIDQMVAEVVSLIIEDSRGRGDPVPSSPTQENLLHLIRAVVKEELESLTQR